MIKCIMYAQIHDSFVLFKVKFALLLCILSYFDKIFTFIVPSSS